MLNDERSETESSCLNLETGCTQSTTGEKNITQKQTETSYVIDRHISDSPTCPVEEGFVEYVESDEEYQDSDFDDVIFQSFITFLAIDI